MVLNAVRAYHLHKNQGQFPKNSIFFFFQLCSLVNLGWGQVKDKSGIGSNADSKQSGGYMCLSSCFLGAACALLLWMSRVDMCVYACVRARVRMYQSVCELMLQDHIWLKMLGTSQTGFTLPFYSAQG